MTIDTYTTNFHIRKIIPTDKDFYMSLRQEASDLKNAYEEFPQFLDSYWEALLKGENEICMVAFTLDTPKICIAICNYQFLEEGHVDIGYDVLEEYRGRGGGTKLAADLVTLAHQYFPKKKVFIRTRAYNKASQRVAEKCGGTLIGKEPTPEVKITMEMLEKYGESGNKSLSLDEIANMKDIIEQGREGVFVFQMP